MVWQMSLLRFCEWLASTPGSIALHESRYVFLIILTVHVLTLAVFALRMMRPNEEVTVTDESASGVAPTGQPAN